MDPAGRRPHGGDLPGWRHRDGEPHRAAGAREAGQGDRGRPARPPEEYEAGHVAGALSIPLGEFEARLAELPADVEVVAYCRGPFCGLAPQGVSLLRGAGWRARRLEDGFPEWRLAGLPVVTGTLPA